MVPRPEGGIDYGTLEYLQFRVADGKIVEIRVGMKVGRVVRGYFTTTIEFLLERVAWEDRLDRAVVQLWNTQLSDEQTIGWRRKRLLTLGSEINFSFDNCTAALSAKPPPPEGFALAEFNFVRPAGVIVEKWEER